MNNVNKLSNSRIPIKVKTDQLIGFYFGTRERTIAPFYFAPPLRKGHEQARVSFLRYATLHVRILFHKIPAEIQIYHPKPMKNETQMVSLFIGTRERT